MANRWKNIHHVLQLASPPTPKKKNKLFNLITESNAEEVQEALREDPDGQLVLSCDERNRSALHWSAMSTSDRSITDILLQAGCDVDAVDGRGRTPLHYAVESGYIDQVTALLQSGADADASFDLGLTALQIASRDNKVSITKELLRFGAAVDGKSGSERHR